MRDLLLRAPHLLHEAAARAQAKARCEFTLERYQAQMMDALESLDGRCSFIRPSD
jgi:hypothetical protein